MRLSIYSTIKPAGGRSVNHMDAVSLDGLKALAARIWPHRAVDLSMPQVMVLANVIYQSLPDSNLHFLSEGKRGIFIYLRFDNEENYQQGMNFIERVIPHPNGLVRGIDLSCEKARGIGVFTDEENVRIEAFLDSVYSGSKASKGMKP